MMGIIVYAMEMLAVVVLMMIVWGPPMLIIRFINKQSAAPSVGVDPDDYMGGVSPRGFDAHPEAYENSYDTYEMFDDASDGGGGE